MPDNILDFIKNEQNIGEKFVHEIKNSQSPFYCYGAGHYLQFSLAYLEKYGLKPVAILDTNCSGKYAEFDVITYDAFMQSNPDPDCKFLITAPSHRHAIEKKLTEFFKSENIYAFETEIYLNFFPSIDKYREYLAANWEELIAFKNDLQDEISKQTFDCVLQGRISGNQDFFSRCYRPDQYYPKDLVQFSEDEVMVELGSNNGETLAEFLLCCPQFKRIYCFEPDKNCVPLLENIKQSRKEYGDKISIEQKGAWSKTTTLYFALDGNVTAGNGHLVSDKMHSTEAVEVAAIDDIVSESITYMKMDIEGCELEALHGAKKQIAVNKPVLAICVYHKMDDFVLIWSYLKSLNPDYRFYLRHHNQFSATETVLYAIK